MAALAHVRRRHALRGTRASVVRAERSHTVRVLRGRLRRWQRVSCCVRRCRARRAKTEGDRLRPTRPRKGIKCRMTDAGPIETPVTMQTFKDATCASKESVCNIGQIRLVGQEESPEALCPSNTCVRIRARAGVVAFIPLAGNSNPYESLDCHAAARRKRGVACELTPAKVEVEASSPP